MKTPFDLIGNTPLVHLPRISRNLGANIFVKDESRNLSGSVKDRAALRYLQQAKESGEIRPKGAIIEACTSFLGLSLAVVSAKMNLFPYLVLFTDTPPARMALLRAMSVQLIPCLSNMGMKKSLVIAEHHSKEIWDSYQPRQFDNPQGPLVHYETTGPEILADCEAANIRPNIFIDGVASGATVSGVGRFLKERVPSISIIAVEPEESPVLSGGQAGQHDIYGIGFDFVPPIFDCSVVDEIISVSSKMAAVCTQRLARIEAMFLGIASGANLAAAIDVASRPENKGKNIIITGRESAASLTSLKPYANY